MRLRRPWALPLVPLYWAGLRAKDLLRGAGVLHTRQLERPVISVGSISAGGAGKTPVIIALAKLLEQAGAGVTVLSRGYGRVPEAPALAEKVDPDAHDAARRFGDEPVLIAASLPGVNVWVGADRFAAGLRAEKQFGDRRAVLLLDDGFQHRRLGRALDVVLVTAQDLDDALLPAGNRREPFAALRRAGVIVIREEEADLVEPRLRRIVQGISVWKIKRGVYVPCESCDRQLVAFAGIARPEAFVNMLQSRGLRIIEAIRFRDHHRYMERDMRHLVGRLQAHGGTGFITTEKDAVKITPELRSLLEIGGPLYVARLHVAFTEPERVIAELEARCR